MAAAVSTFRGTNGEKGPWRGQNELPVDGAETNEGILVQTFSRWSVGLTLGSIGLLILLVSAVTLVYRSPSESCLTMAAPAGASISEVDFPTGRLSWFPLGLACDFPRSGGGVISTTPGPELTIALVLLLAALAIGVLMMLRTKLLPARA